MSIVNMAQFCKVGVGGVGGNFLDLKLIEHTCINGSHGLFTGDSFDRIS